MFDFPENFYLLVIVFFFRRLFTYRCTTEKFPCRKCDVSNVLWSTCLFEIMQFQTVQLSAQFFILNYVKFLVLKTSFWLSPLCTQFPVPGLARDKVLQDIQDIKTYYHYYCIYKKRMRIRICKKGKQKLCILSQFWYSIQPPSKQAFQTRKQLLILV